MFGFFKKKPPRGSFILVAIQSSVLLWEAEKRNGGLFTSPNEIRLTVSAFAKKMGVELDERLRQVTETCVMKFLMDQTFVEVLLQRASTGPIGTLTEQDEREIDRIVGSLFE